MYHKPIKDFKLKSSFISHFVLHVYGVSNIKSSVPSVKIHQFKFHLKVKLSYRSSDIHRDTDFYYFLAYILFCF